MSDPTPYDVVVLGSGPGGQKAAVQAAKTARRVAVVEQDAAPGGACVRRGTIPSKSLRETTLALASFRRRSGGVFAVSMPETLTVESLMTRLDEVVRAHQRIVADQLARNGVELVHGRARFVSAHEVEVLMVGGSRRRLRGETIVVAVGSMPRTPPEIPVDHATILDSDSILSLAYLPRSLAVLGAGVIACEYASVFAALGVAVTMVDRGDAPLGFLDRETTDHFRQRFEAAGGRFVGNARVASVATDGLAVHTRLAGGETIVTEKMLCALGRVAALDRLEIAAAGLTPNARGLLDVDAHCRTAVPHVYAVGDVVGPPALAASAMEQGRRAVCHALGMDPGPPPELTPVGVYTIPEIASVGLTEAQARARHGAVAVGRARFEELARGHIAGAPEGLLKIVAAADGGRLHGVQIVGESAAELIHLGQMALVCGAGVEVFVDNVFNFPTWAEAYRVAALDLLGRSAARTPRPERLAGSAA